jgi:hypothetical protein
MLVLAAPAPGQTPHTWSGTWVNSAPDGSFWVLSQSGQKVDGVWKGSGSSGTLTGTVAGSTLTGQLVNNEANQAADFSITLAEDGRSFSGTFTITGGGGGQWRSACTGGACLGNAAPAPPAGPPATPPATPPTVPSGPTVALSRLSRRVEVQLNEGAWVPATAALQLRPGDRIHTGWKSGATLTLPDGSKLEVKPMSMVQIGTLEVGPDGRVSGRVLLQLGEVRAQVNRLRGSSADFEVKTPTSTTSVRGTKFTVFFDGSRTLVSVTQGSVSLKPGNGRAVLVAAGREASADGKSAGPVAAIGRAGAPAGSVAPARARALIESFLGRGTTACGATPDSVKLKAVKHGWRATLTLVGSPAGKATLKISGSSVSATNRLARRLRAGCR